MLSDEALNRHRYVNTPAARVARAEDPMSVPVAAPMSDARSAVMSRRRLNPLVGYGLAAILSACIWALLLSALF